MPPRQPHIQGRHLAYVGAALSTRCRPSIRGSILLRCRPISHLVLYQPGATIQFGAATATSLGAAPLVIWRAIMQMPPHQSNAAPLATHLGRGGI